MSECCRPSCRRAAQDISESPLGSLEEIEGRKTALQAARFADAEQLAHDQAQITGRCHHFVSLVDLLQAAKPGSPRAACLAYVGETSFNQLAAFLLQTLAAVSSHSTSIGTIRFFEFRRLVDPDAFVV